MLSAPVTTPGSYYMPLPGRNEPIHIRRDAVLCWLCACSWFALGAFVEFRPFYHTPIDVTKSTEWPTVFHFTQQFAIALLYPFGILFWSLYAIERAFARFRNRKLNGNEDQTNLVLNAYIVTVGASLLFFPALLATGVWAMRGRN